MVVPSALVCFPAWKLRVMRNVPFVGWVRSQAYVCSQTTLQLLTPVPSSRLLGALVRCMSRNAVGPSLTPHILPYRLMSRHLSPVQGCVAEPLPLLYTLAGQLL